MDGVASVFSKLARDDPGRSMIAAGDWQVTRSEFEAAADKIGRALITSGGSPGDRVAVLMGHCGPLFAAILGVWKAGRVAVAMNPGDPSLRLSAVVENADAGIVVVDAANYANAVRLAGPGRRVLAVEEVLRGPRVVELQANADEDSIACLIFTSGTTGEPKGVIKSHHMLLNQTKRLMELMRLDSSDRVLHLASVAGGQGLGTLVACLATGAAICPFPIMERGITGLSGFMHDHRVTVFISSSSIFRHFAGNLGPADRFPDIRLVRLASEPATPGEFRLFRQHFPPESILLHTLASSETGVIAGQRITESDCIEGRPLPVGRMLPGVKLSIHDDDGAEVRDGTVGRITVEGQGLFSGYWGETNGNPQPVRYFHTGDLGYMDGDGTLNFAGRADDRVKIRGNRIHLGEVERAMKNHPLLSDAVVLARAREDGGAELVGVGVPYTGSTVTATEVRAHLHKILAPAKVPSLIHFVKKIPWTANGKADRSQILNSLLEAGNPVCGCREEPHSGTERLLADIWSAVLGCGETGRTDDFYSLGGDSLSGAVIAARLHAECGVDLTPLDIAANPVLANLAAVVDGKKGGARETPPLVRVSRAEGQPLSFAQERLWGFIGQTTAHNVSQQYLLRGMLDVDLLRESFRVLIERHEAFRTGFEEHQGQILQVIHPENEMDFEVHDFSASPDPDVVAERLFHTAAAKPFEMSRPPLLRLILVRVAPDMHFLYRVTHHIISDGWSWRLFFEELETVFTAKLHGEPVVLDPLPIQYADYAAWERRVLSRETPAYQEMLAWWLQKLTRRTRPLLLPFQRAIPEPAAEISESIFWWGLDPEVARKLNQLAKECGVTPYSVRVAVLTALLTATTGRKRFDLGVYANNRSRVELQRIFGIFVNLVPLRVSCSLSETFRDWTRNVGALVVETNSHATLPFEPLCEELIGNRIVPPDLQMIINSNAAPRLIQLGEAQLMQPWRLVETMPWGISITLNGADEQHGCRVDFDARLHDPDGVRRFMSQFVELCRIAAEQPGESLTGLTARALSADNPDFGYAKPFSISDSSALGGREG